MAGDDLIARFGTAEPPPAAIALAAGPMTVEVVAGAARNLRWHGTEIVRAIDCLVRDESWGTYQPEDVHESASEQDGGFVFERRAAIAAGAIGIHLVFTARPEGIFRAEAELTARRDFRTNRAGLTLLHPIGGLAGSPLTVRHSDGSVARAEFPRFISPSQPVLDIAGLSYQLDGVEAAIVFEGEVFEMEDQRNWTDASYKTYCRPLSRPYPYTLSAGERIRQTIEIRLRRSGVSPLPSPTKRRDAASTVASAQGVLRAERSDPAETMPEVALAVDATCLPDRAEGEAVRRAEVGLFRVRIRPETLATVCTQIVALSRRTHPEVELEIVVPNGEPLDDCLGWIARQIATAPFPFRVRRVIALPEDYLQNFQPEGPWPSGSTPRDAAAAARRAFPGARIGGGMLTHFTELNRCRPDLTACDYITHGTCAILHAAGDRTVMENLEGLAHVFASARELAKDREYHAGLVSIALRTNPHAAEVAPNPHDFRLPAAGTDPRQRGLFAAAWAVGAMAATEGHGVSSLALATPVGRLGIVHRRGASPAPVYDERPGTSAYPLFHVVRAFAELGGAPRARLEGLPPGTAGIAAVRSGGFTAMVANLGDQPRQIRLPQGAKVRQGASSRQSGSGGSPLSDRKSGGDAASTWLLDEAAFADAIADPGWLRHGEAPGSAALTLLPYAVAFIHLPQNSS